MFRVIFGGWMSMFCLPMSRRRTGMRRAQTGKKPSTSREASGKAAPRPRCRRRNSDATVPKAENKSEVLFEAASATTWFKNSVYGLQKQIDDSAGYVIFPDVVQWGFLMGGGEYGRGVLYSPDGS